MDSEMRWIERIKNDASRSAANKLVSKYYKEMYAFIYKQTLDGELSLDLTQEIFISVLKSIKNYDSEKASFRTWLYKLASNRLIDFYRSRSYKDAKLVQPIEDYEFEDDQDMAVSLEYKEDFAKITALVNELDAASQHIVRLKLFGEYTFQEIAAIEKIPQSTVKTKYYGALKQIRKGMEEHHG
ncbi:RNA polymerase sigma factor [Brevibacillus borstelensis]|uniref:RNA polymerase sigma factor n=1 Tax=Brevibacillus borstelensis TaxID=45462 RepID=UPI0030C2D7EB